MEKYFYIAIIVLLFIFSGVYKRYLRKKLLDDLFICMQHGDEEGFTKILTSFNGRMIIPPFNRDYLRLNYALLHGQNAKAEEILAAFADKHLNAKQKEEVYVKGFNYYLAKEDHDKAAHYLELAKSLKNEKLLKELDRNYDVYLAHGYKYLDATLKELATLEENYRGPGEYLVAKMYENKGDEAKAQEYYHKSEESIKKLDAKLKNKEAERTN